jgi:hypothetical protein
MPPRGAGLHPVQVSSPGGTDFISAPKIEAGIIAPLLRRAISRSARIGEQRDDRRLVGGDRIEVAHLSVPLDHMHH